MSKLAIFGTSGFSKEVLDIAIDQYYKEIVFLTHDENIKGEVLGLGYEIRAAVRSRSSTLEFIRP